MKSHAFSIIADGLDPFEPGLDDRFFEAGCDDATIAFQKGLLVLDFDRESPSLARAIKTAIQDVRKVGARVRHVEPDQFVSLSDIAARSGLTRQAASHYANGSRGKGFPRPVARITTDSPLWDWVEVARWLRRHGRLSRLDVVHARVVRRANQRLVEDR